MNLKDRLIISNQNNVKVKNSNGEYVYTTDEIFADSKKAGEIIRELILNNRNIIFVHNTDFDSNLFINYIQILMRDKQLNLLNDFDETRLVNNNINLIKDPKINNVVKIFEYIIYGYKPFIFNICLNSVENVEEKLSAVISVNYQNLSEKNINTLITSSACVFVSIEKNDNSFVISSVYEADGNSYYELMKSIPQTYNDNEITDITENVDNSEKEDIEKDIDDELMNYNSEEHIFSGDIDSDEEKSEVEDEEDDDDKVILDVESHTEEEQEEEEKQEEPEEEQEAEKEEQKLPPKKENKYKLLRDKVRRKRKENL